MMFHHHRPVPANVSTATTSLPPLLALKVEPKPGRTASPFINDSSEEERSPPSSPALLHHPHPQLLHLAAAIDAAGHQREQQVIQQVGYLATSIRRLSDKALAEGLSVHDRELLKGQLAALERLTGGTNMRARLGLPPAPLQLVDDIFRRTTATTASRAVPVADQLASPQPEASSFDDDHHHHLHQHQHHHLGVMSAKAHKKRAKRTFNRACVHCGTQFTSQWRKGPAGASTLCNACGIRYARRLKKDAKADAQAAAAAAAQAKPREDASSKRSTVYSLLN